MVEVAPKLRFFNEYEDLETAEPGDRAKAFRGTVYIASWSGG